MTEHDDVLVEQQAGSVVAQQLGERSLATFDGFKPEIVAVHLDEVEGVEEDVPIIAPVTQSVELPQAIVITGHGLTVDQA